MYSSFKVELHVGVEVPQLLVVEREHRLPEARLVAPLQPPLAQVPVEQLPELHWTFGYPFALGLIGLSVGAAFWLFKRYDWF